MFNIQLCDLIIEGHRRDCFIPFPFTLDHVSNHEPKWFDDVLSTFLSMWNFIRFHIEFRKHFNQNVYPDTQTSNFITRKTIKLLISFNDISVWYEWKCYFFKSLLYSANGILLHDSNPLKTNDTKFSLKN